jgi:archaeosine synthase
MICTLVIKSQKFFAFARSGILEKDSGTIQFPMILSHNELVSDFENFNIAGESCERMELKNGNESFSYLESENFIVPKGVLQNRISASSLINTIMMTKKLLGYDKLLYIPGISDPYILPALYYLGVDVFDELTADIEGINHTSYTMFGRVVVDRDSSLENREFMRKEVKLLGIACEKDMLIEAVEKFNVSHKNTEILRKVQNNHYELYEKMYPRTTPAIFAGTLDSLGRPDIVRYNRYIRENYIKPNNAKIALFIPCSAKKPYSQSRSHRALIEAIGKYRKYVHEIIVSSPIALVPRELEETYPPSFYDIPVTGRWYSEEVESIRKSIQYFIKRNEYDSSIFFLPEDMKFIENFEIPNSVYITWDKKKENPFDTLLEQLSQIRMDNGSRRDYLMEKFSSVAAYQFGNWIVPYILKMKVMKSYNQFMLSSSGKPNLIYNDKLGKLTINREGAWMFLKESKFCIEIDNFRPTASVYAMGVLGSTPEVRREDEVVVHHNNELRGVGIAKMPHELLGKVKKGIAIKMRN